MRDLPQRMDAGIRAPGSVDRDLLARKLLDGLGNGALHRRALGLDLPADEARAVVFERDSVASHRWCDQGPRRQPEPLQ